MDDADVALRNDTYRLVVDLGRVPTAPQVAAVTGRTAEDVLAGWLRLHDAHALVLEAGGTAIRMANPFSGVPTAHRVQAEGRWWYANCAWDAFGICAALGTDGRIESSCPDCGEPLAVAVRDREPDRDDLLFLCPVPAQHWWDDIVAT
ncbi:Alkylmercury lyase [Geodermatophilus pulveris]|uniref:Alkylmercury lyase n=1 Tax=Geodermatophilus pulveris TaxID=1564159 RepID=A0A239DSD8_9ACTN|nr:organomercurial lyase [Geodermatophilus pulveris]SNS34662.1 Alkylmercury lyase [Geodermatophilus pulveris]